MWDTWENNTYHSSQFEPQSNFAYGLGYALRPYVDKMRSLTSKLLNWVNPPRPSAVWVTADRVYEGLPSKDIDIYQNNNKNLQNELSQYYNFQKYENVNTTSEICQALKETHQQGPIGLFILNAHGAPYGIRLGAQVLAPPETIIGIQPLDKEDLSCFGRYLDENTKIILYSCSTAASNHLTLNMQQWLTSLVPGSTSFAPHNSVAMGSLQITYAPSFAVMGTILDPSALYLPKDSPTYIKMIKKMQAVEEYRLKEYQDRFTVFSPLEALFYCQQINWYYQLQQYCEHPSVNTRPTADNVLNCLTEPSCLTAVIYFRPSVLKFSSPQTTPKSKKCYNILTYAQSLNKTEEPSIEDTVACIENDTCWEILQKLRILIK